MIPNIVTPFVPKRLFFTVSEAKKKAGVYCAAYGCKNKPCARKRGLCHCHYRRFRATTDPVYDRYTNFKGNAERRGKEFTITIEEFRQFCETTGYIIKKGRRGKLATVDRIDNTQGYHIWNIQLITNAANISKYYDVDRLLTENTIGSRWDNEELPF